MTLAGTGSVMSKASGISVSSVQRIWRAHGLGPHLVCQFKLSKDPQFAAKLKDIVGLYVNPPDHATRRPSARTDASNPGWKCTCSPSLSLLIGL